MYSVSEDYKVASLKPSRESRVEGYIQMSDTTTIAFDSSDILAGSLSIDNAAVNGQELNLGTVYCGKMQATLKLSIDRYSLYNKKISLSYFLKVGDEWEEVPLGVYYIAEAKRSGKHIAITAYDQMLDFDKEFSSVTTGKPSTLIMKSCEKCKIEMEQTAEEIDLISPTMMVIEEGIEVEQIIQYGLPTDNSISSYRMLLSELAIILGGFFIMGRTGKLRFVKFGTETGITITDNIRKNAEIYDYQCSYSGVKAVVDDGYYIAGTSNKIVLDVGELNLLKNGLIETKTKTIDFIYEQIKDLKYTPGSVEFIGDPAIDLGDMVTIKGYDADEDGTRMCVTSYNWTFHGKHKLQTVGKNIKVADSKKQTTQQIKVVAESVKQSSFQKIVTFYNAEGFEVGPVPYRIARLMVPVSEKTSILATGQMVLNVTTPGTIKLTYKLNDVVGTFTPKQILPVEGCYMVNILYVLKDIEEFSQNIFEVFIESEDAVATVESEQCIINLSGSGIVDVEEWDGTLAFEESISVIYLGNINMNVKYSDELKTSFHTCLKKGFTENYNPIFLGSSPRLNDTQFNVSMYEKNPTSFNEQHRKIQFSFGGLCISDEMQLTTETT